MARSRWLKLPGCRVAHHSVEASGNARGTFYLACWTPFWTSEQEDEKLAEARPAPRAMPKCKRCLRALRRKG